MKKITITVTKETQEELNELRKSIGLEEEPIKEPYEIEALFG